LDQICTERAYREDSTPLLCTPITINEILKKSKCEKAEVPWELARCHKIEGRDLIVLRCG